jgi:NNP family nitrate/nitrite transporter-like MFS transporter
MSAIILALVFGFLFVKSYNDVLAMGVLLSIAGASFGVALSLGSGWFPKQYKGLAMGIAGAGNSGTALAALFAPRLAMNFGWQHVYGFAAAMMLLPLLVMVVFAKEPPDIEHQSLRQHLSCLFESDGWMFNLIYIITFGGFLGLATFLPSFYYSQFHVTKVQAGTLTVLATLTGSLTRVLGGWFADRVGGITTLSVVFFIAIAGLFGLMTTPPLVATAMLFMLCFAALGAGNGATFQLVPLRWPLTTAVAGAMIGEIGALGGGILPNLLGQSKQHTGSYRGGFLLYAFLAVGGTCCYARSLPLLDSRLDSSWRSRHRNRSRAAGCYYSLIRTYRRNSGLRGNDSDINLGRVRYISVAGHVQFDCASG